MTGNPDKARDESPFWRFSLRFYSRPGVSAACLMLQDESGVDVNLMLFLLFLAEHKRLVTRDDVAKLDAAVAAWRAHVVKPLREVRRALKTGIGEIPIEVNESFRGQIKRLELESEHIEQHVLERFDAGALGSEGAARMEVAAGNLAAYGAYLGSIPAGALATVLAAFDEFGRHHATGLA